VYVHVYMEMHCLTGGWPLTSINIHNAGFCTYVAIIMHISTSIMSGYHSVIQQ